MAKQELKVKIGADNKPLKKGLDDSGKQVEGFSGKVSKLGSKLKMLAGAAAIGAVVKGLFDMAKQVSENADRLLDLEQQTGLSTDTLQEYEQVARVAGVNSEAMSNAVMGLTQRLARGAEMSAGLKMGLDALNVEVFDASGKMRDLGQVSEQAIEQLAQMDDITQRNVIGAQLFSGAWKDLAPIMALGKDGIEAAKKEARELGLVMSKEGLEAANEFRVEMETLNAQWAAAKRDITMLFLPALQALITGTGQLASNFRELNGLVKDMNSDESLKWYEKAWTWTKMLVGGHKGMTSAINDMIESSYRVGQQIDENTEKTKKNANEQIVSIRTVSLLEKELADEKKAYSDASSTQQQALHLMRINQIQAEINKMNELAQAGAQSNISAYLEGRGMGGLGDVQSLGAMLTDGHEETLRKLAETDIALKNISKSSKDLSTDLQQVEFMANEVGAAFGNAFGRMVSEGRDATQEIIKQMLAQVVAALIKASVAQFGLFGVAVGAAAPGIAQGLFSMIPSYATGTSNHPGGMALVGEQGPELVNLPRGSSVYTNQESMGMMGGKVEFEIRGEKLYGVLRRYTNRQTLNG